MEDVQTAMKATTALVAAGGMDHKAVISDWTKATVLRLKNTSTNDKSELQRLNLELQKYLGDVRILEELNSALLAEVDAEKSRSKPKIMDKSALDEKLHNMRVDLENESLNAVEFEIKAEETKALTAEIGERTKFLTTEADIARKKMQILQSQLAEIQAQKDTLGRGVTLAEETINREQERASKAEIDLDKLTKSLSAARSRNKKIEFEIHTYMDELSFRKEVHKEELHDLNNRVSQGPLSSVDLNNFYKSELVNAVRQIRDDFQILNERQLSDYKKHKEGELAVSISIAEEEKAFAQQVLFAALFADNLGSLFKEAVKVLKPIKKNISK